MLYNFKDKSYLIKRARKNLTLGYSNKAGRNFFGRKTIFTQSGGLPFKLRVIDFKRNFLGKGKILSIEKDINRTALVGTVCLENGYFSNIILSSNNQKIKDKDDFFVNYSSKMKLGSVHFLHFILTGTFIHHIEIKPGKGAVYCRAAGTSGFLISKDNRKRQSFLKMNSGWLLKLSNWCMGVPGITSNETHCQVRINKAGKNRLLGFRPHVRGVVKNPCDHPHGGGEGKGSPSSIHKTPYGKNTKTPTKRKKLDYKKRKKFKIFSLNRK